MCFTNHILTFLRVLGWVAPDPCPSSQWAIIRLIVARLTGFPRKYSSIPTWTNTAVHWLVAHAARNWVANCKLTVSAIGFDKSIVDHFRMHYHSKCIDSIKKPKMRLDHLRGVMTRHDDMMRVFNRRQRETIRRVEHVFESSHRQIDTVLIGHGWSGRSKQD